MAGHYPLFRQSFCFVITKHISPALESGSRRPGPWCQVQAHHLDPGTSLPSAMPTGSMAVKNQRAVDGATEQDQFSDCMGSVVAVGSIQALLPG